MKKKQFNNITLSSMFIAIGVVLPILTNNIRVIGNMLLPMHFTVFLAGMICGPIYGLIVGIITPLIRSLLFGMPLFFPNAIAMCFELASYGFISGYIYNKIKINNIIKIYLSLIIAMILGRIIWGLISVVFYGFCEKTFTYKIFITGALLNAIPGIIIQLILIPLIMSIIKEPLISRHLQSMFCKNDDF